MYSPPIFIELNAKLLSELPAYNWRIPTVSFSEDIKIRQTHMSLRESCVLDAAADILNKFSCMKFLWKCVCVGSGNDCLMMWVVFKNRKKGGL